MPPFLVTNYIIKATTEVPRAGLITGGAPQIVTALPTNPVFGDVVTYIADATNGVFWYLQYDATGTYPWKFVGGAELRASVAGAANTASATFATLSGPTLAIVLPGEYDVTVQANITAASQVIGGMGVAIGAGGVTDFIWGPVSAINYWNTHNVTLPLTVTVAATLNTHIKSPQSVSMDFSSRVIRATPIRVKAA